MRKFYEKVCRSEIVLAGASFAISCIVIFASAIARSLDHPFNWAQDISLFLFSWSVFLSADVALRADKLVSIDLLVNRFPDRIQTIIKVVNYLIILVFLAAIAFFGIKLSIFSWRRAFQGIPGFSYGWVTLSLPIGGMLIGITTILKLRGLVRSLNQTTSAKEA